MVEDGRASLRRLLVSGYDELRRRLTRRFGSVDLATEVLHETWIRLDHMTDVAPLHKPRSYLYRMALNVAADRRRAEIRWLNKSELMTLLHSDDDQLDPEQIVGSKFEMAALERALAELPSRSREIFMVALLEELTYREIASRFGVSLRTVEREMNRTFTHCSKVLDKVPGRRRVDASRNVLHIAAAQSCDPDTHDDD